MKHQKFMAGLLEANSYIVMDEDAHQINCGELVYLSTTFSFTLFIASIQKVEK